MKLDRKEYMRPQPEFTAGEQTMRRIFGETKPPVEVVTNPMTAANFNRPLPGKARKKRCPQCGREFWPSSPNRVYCMDACRWQAKLDRLTAARRAVGITGVRPVAVTPREKVKLAMKIAASAFGMTIYSFTSPCRERPVAWARQGLMLLLKEYLKVPAIRIGRLLGNRDHSTIVYGIQAAELRLSENQATADCQRWIAAFRDAEEAFVEAFGRPLAQETPLNSAE